MAMINLPKSKPNIKRIRERDMEATFATGGLDAREEEKQKRGTITDRYLIYMLGRFLRPYSWQLGGVFVLLVIVSGLNLLLPYLVKLVVDGPIKDGNADALIPFGVLYIATIAAIFMLRFAYTFWLQNIGQNALMNLRQEMFEHIIKQDMTYFNHTPIGKLTARFSNDIEALTELLSTSIVMVASNMMTLIGIIVVMFILNWRLALISIITLPMMTVMSVYFRRYLRRLSGRFHRIVGEFQAFLNEYFNGMLIVQLFGREQQTRDDFNLINTRYFSTNADLRDIYTYYAATLQFLTSLGLAIVLWGGGGGVFAGWVTLGMLIAFIDYTQRAFVPIIQLSEQFAQIQTALSAAERVARLLLVESDIRETENPTPITHFDKTVVFDDVSFSYDEGHPVLKHINLHIKAGERVAIVGATGAGKTSLVKLLARFHDVNDGRVLISGVDIRQLSMADLRRYVTVVPQNPYCFDGTIADNLRLFDDTITREQMIEAAKTASAHPFIEKLPNGYDYQLLPGGANLSHGQRQLLALARALIHSPEGVLVLDEATSNIDTETEIYIQEGLRHVLMNRTSLIIAHRLSTVRDADRIIVMMHGEIIEEGTHDALLAQEGVYAQLYRRQFVEEAVEG